MYMESWTVPHRATRPVSISDETPIVFVVDEDIDVRESLELLISSADWQPKTFSSATEFLPQAKVPVPSCVVVDINLPGLDVQSILSVDRSCTPVIFIAGYADIPMTVRAMKAGAVEFLMKPFSDEVMLTTIEQALERSRTALKLEAERRTIEDRYATLSRREKEVMALVVSGLLNKQVAFELGISEITVKAHRGSMMRKMKVTSLADLVRAAAKLAVWSPSGRGQH